MSRLVILTTGELASLEKAAQALQAPDVPPGTVKTQAEVLHRAYVMHDALDRKLAVRISEVLADIDDGLSPKLDRMMTVKLSTLEADIHRIQEDRAASERRSRVAEAARRAERCTS